MRKRIAAKKWYEKHKLKETQELEERARERRDGLEKSLSNEWESQESKDYWLCELQHQNHGWPSRGTAVPPSVYLRMIEAVRQIIQHLEYKEGPDDKKIQMTKTLCIAEAKRRYLVDADLKEKAMQKAETDAVLQQRLAVLNADPYSSLKQACRAPMPPPARPSSVSAASSSSSDTQPSPTPRASVWALPRDFLPILISGTGVALASVLSSGKTTAFILEKVIQAMTNPSPIPIESGTHTEDSQTPSDSPKKKKPKRNID